MRFNLSSRRKTASSHAVRASTSHLQSPKLTAKPVSSTNVNYSNYCTGYFRVRSDDSRSGSAAHADVRGVATIVNKLQQLELEMLSSALLCIAHIKME